MTLWLIPNEIQKFMGNKNTKLNTYRMQQNDSIMCGYIFIGFIDFMLKGKSFIDYTSLFFPNRYEKNNKVILK